MSPSKKQKVQIVKIASLEEAEQVVWKWIWI